MSEEAPAGALFTKRFHARWGDMDFNAHMRNTAYLDVSGDVRMMYFQEHGFTMRDFQRLGVGPVITRDELEYYREMRLLDGFDVTLAVAGFSEDFSRFRFRNDFHRDDGKLVARVTSVGGWLDLAARRITPPPDALAEVLRGMARAEDFATIVPEPRG